MSKKDNKAMTLAKSWGCLCSNKLAEDYMFSSVVPAICMNDNCNYTTGMEPDATHGCCEICETRTVKSILILKDVI